MKKFQELYVYMRTNSSEMKRVYCGTPEVKITYENEMIRKGFHWKIVTLLEKVKPQEMMFHV